MFVRFDLLSLLVALLGACCTSRCYGEAVRTASDIDEGKDDGSTTSEQARRRDAAASPRRPNLLFILTDQQRSDALGYVQRRHPGYANKFKLKTPNLDALAADGVDFSSAYCASPLCVPSRGSIHTGNTVRRTGLGSNQLMLPEYYQLMDIFEDRIKNLTTLERVLAAEMNYTVEFYGKCHLSWTLLKHPYRPGSVIQYNYYSFANDSFNYQEEFSYFRLPYQQNVLYLLDRDGVKPPFGPQCNTWTTYGYSPIPFDDLYGKPYVNRTGDLGWRIGRDQVAAKYSPSALLGQIGLKALNRLIDASDPFALYVSFNAPHAPYFSSGETMDPYEAQSNNLYISPNINDKKIFSAYGPTPTNPNFKWNKPQLIKDWVAAYYGMTEDMDIWVGKLMQVLKDRGQWNNTMIVFTSDHGEMLGAHAMGGKQNLLEEALRVPLIVKLPSGEKNRVSRVDTPVSQVDLFSTVLDYLGAPPSVDTSDGRSLRRHIERLSYSERYDDTAVVVEYDERYPTSTTQLSGVLGIVPGYSIRRGQYKLILPRTALSTTLDMMYDLKNDPGETRNLLGGGATTTNLSDALVGKAEHLKALLVDYMKRHNGPGYYSDKKYNNNEGSGDMREVFNRRTWRRVDWWQSETRLVFGTPSQLQPGVYARNEYLYLGRSTSGSFTVTRITLSGPWAASFSFSPPLSSWPSGTAVVRGGQYRRLQVRFRSSKSSVLGNMAQVNATLTIVTSIGTKTVRLGG